MPYFNSDSPQPEARSWRRSNSSLVLVLISGLAAGTMSPHLFADSADSRVTLSGTVETTDGQAVPQATVRLLPLRRETRTDTVGRFEFPNVSPGNYYLEARGLVEGHAVASIEVAGKAAELTLTLLDETHQDEIVVTASPSGRSQQELAQPTTVLDGEGLLDSLETSLGETLQGQAGISSTSFGLGASRPLIRGLGGDRVRTLEDGIGSLDASATSPDHAVSVDPAGAERLEVLRGPATLLYGSSAIGGVVNVLDGRIPDYRASVPLSGQLAVLAGSVADETTGSLRLGGGDGDWAWSFGAVGRQTNDYEIPGRAAVGDTDAEGSHGESRDFGRVSNSDLESRSARFGVSRFFGDRGFLGASLSGFESNYGLPGAEEHHAAVPDDDPLAEPEEEGDVRIDLEQRRFDLRGEMSDLSKAFARLRFRVGLVDYEHDEIEGSGEIGTTFFNDAWEGRIELVQRERGSLAGSLGVQVKVRDLVATGEEAFIPQADSTNLGVFAFEEIARGNVRYQLGVRYERQETQTSAAGLPDRSFDALSASVGGVLFPEGGWSFGGHLARAVKTPNGEELYSRGPHFASGLFEIGDPALVAESSLGIDLFVRKNSGRLTGELHLFRNDFSDFIFQAFSGEIEDGLPVAIWTQAGAEFSGAELAATLELVDNDRHHLDLELTGDVVHAELDDGRDLPRIPPMRIGMGLHYHRGGFRAAARVRDVDRQNRVFDNELPTAGHTLVSASLGYRWIFTRAALDILLRGSNLGDEKARNHSSFLKDRVPLPGRDLRLDLRYTF